MNTEKNQSKIEKINKVYELLSDFDISIMELKIYHEFIFIMNNISGSDDEKHKVMIDDDRYSLHEICKAIYDFLRTNGKDAFLKCGRNEFLKPI